MSRLSWLRLWLVGVAIAAQWVFWPLNSRADITYIFSGDATPFQQFSYSTRSFVTVDVSLLASQLTSSTNCIVIGFLPCVGFYINPIFAPFPSDVITFTSPHSGIVRNFYYFPGGRF